MIAGPTYRELVRKVAWAIALLLALGVALGLLVGCAEVQAYGSAAIEYRKTMNDMQAHAAMAGICDLSVGSVARLPEQQRNLASTVCGLDVQPIIMMPTRLQAAGD